MTPAELTAFVSERLAAVADPSKAPQMAAYMKTDMPFYGVSKPARALIEREIRKRFKPTSRGDYLDGVERLWSLPHREEKYLALFVARSAKAFIDRESMPLYERLIRTGAWWDFVDEVAVRLVGRVVLDDPELGLPLMDEWIHDDDMWVRRTAIISQLKHKQATDAARLFRYCRARAPEKEFFIRKAIGWALREYSKTAPDAVRAFLDEHRDELSGLSLREGGKHLHDSSVSPR